MADEPTSVGPQELTAPRCYRHADRETYIRCQRCERPICPDCMRQAAVGFQCPECVREGAKTVRQPRTAFGGRAAGSATGDALVTRVLIGINAVAAPIFDKGGLVAGAVALVLGFASSGLLGAAGVVAGIVLALVAVTFLVDAASTALRRRAG